MRSKATASVPHLVAALFMGGSIGFIVAFAFWVSIGEWAVLPGLLTACVVGYLGYKPREVGREFVSACKAVFGTGPRLLWHALQDLWYKPRPALFHFVAAVSALFVVFVLVDNRAPIWGILFLSVMLGMGWVVFLVILGIVSVIVGMAFPFLEEMVETLDVDIARSQPLDEVRACSARELVMAFELVVPYRVWWAFYARMMAIDVLALLLIGPVFVNALAKIFIRSFRIIHNDVRLICLADSGIGMFLAWGCARLYYGSTFGSQDVMTQLALAAAGGLTCVAIGLLNHFVVKPWFQREDATTE